MDLSGLCSRAMFWIRVRCDAIYANEKFRLILGWLQMQAIFMADVCIWAYNWAHYRYIKWLDLCGIIHDAGGHRYIYYTYEGQKYLILADKKRGPAKRFPLLEEFYKNDPRMMVALMGPNNDWHGRGEEMSKIFDRSDEL